MSGLAFDGRLWAGLLVSISDAFWLRRVDLRQGRPGLALVIISLSMGTACVLTITCPKAFWSNSLVENFSGSSCPSPP